MTNQEFLATLGFFERDGWLCNPKLNGEAIFKIGGTGCHDFEARTIPELCEIITASAFNAGCRWMRDERDSAHANRLRELANEFEGISNE